MGEEEEEPDLYCVLSFADYSCLYSGDPSVDLTVDSVSLRLGHGVSRD